MQMNEIIEKSYENSNYLRNLQPLLIACSAHINDEIEKKAKDNGFDLVLESPLQYDKI